MSSVDKKSLKEINKLEVYLEESKEKKPHFKKMNLELKNIIETFKWSDQWRKK